MFYYPTVLKHRTGCFSTIWLAATKGIRVPLREFLKVNVKSTCDDIMDYVLEQVPPPQPGVPRPRFSLYLSSQLQYGVIVVYHRQCSILLEELHIIVGQLLKPRTRKIDLDDHSRLAQVLPEALSLLEQAEGAQDPFFGVMSMESMQMGEREPSFPEHPERTVAPAKERAITASPDTITLREVGPVSIPTAEFEGVELIDQHPDTLYLLLAETDHFPEEDVGGLRGVVERERGEEDLERERTREFTASSPELQPSTLPSDDALLLSKERPDLSEERPEPPPEQLTPVSVPGLPSPPSADREDKRRSPQLEAVPPQVRRRRTRQLIFFDPETQLCDEELQELINNPLTGTRQIPVPPAPSRRILSAAELLNNPCTFLPEDVLSLWKQAAIITPLSGSDLQFGERGHESTDSEKEREQEKIPVTEREAERQEVTLRGVPLDLAQSEMFDISGLDTLMLEVSDQREISREMSPLYASEKEGSTVSRSVSTLQDIPEVVDKIQESPADGVAGLFPDEHDEGPVSFHSLFPPEVDRRTVSVTFHRLLEVTSARQVHVEQSEPYGDILIYPGAEHLTL